VCGATGEVDADEVAFRNDHVRVDLEMREGGEEQPDTLLRRLLGDELVERSEVMGVHHVLDEALHGLPASTLRPPQARSMRA
jgi:hypothetical protein